MLRLVAGDVGAKAYPPLTNYIESIKMKEYIPQADIKDQMHSLTQAQTDVIHSLLTHTQTHLEYLLSPERHDFLLYVKPFGDEVVLSHVWICLYYSDFDYEYSLSIYPLESVFSSTREHNTHTF